jgi:uncharacterized protein YozE (UPF0346 family)
MRDKAAYRKAGAFYRWLMEQKERKDTIGYLAQDVDDEAFFHHRVPRPALGHFGDFPLWEKYLPKERYDPHRALLDAYWEYFYTED